jgi:hypothetical protein
MSVRHAGHGSADHRARAIGLPAPSVRLDGEGE